MLQVFLERYIQYAILAGIVILAIAVRWVTADFQVIYGADSWLFYRYAQEIYNNNFQLPTWDILSYFPPGRPVGGGFAWSYTIAIFYALTQPFIPGLTLMKFAGLFTPVFASLSAIPAYFAVRLFANRTAALIVAFLAVLSSTFVSVSIAGYPDTDSVEVFYTFLAVLATLYAVKKGVEKLKFENFRNAPNELLRYVPYLLPAFLAYWLFALNWGSSWYIYFIFLFFIPVLILFRFAEAKILHHQKGYIELFYQIARENKGIVIPIVLIGLVGDITTSLTSVWPFFTSPPHVQLISGLAFLGSVAGQNVGYIAFAVFTMAFVSIGAILGGSVGRLKGLIVGVAVASAILALLVFPTATAAHPGPPSLVNRSIAELRPVNVLSFFGFFGTLGRAGSLAALLGVIGLGFLIFVKLVTRRDVKMAEYFALVWILVSLLLILAGTRFTLLFMIAVATSAGFFLGNMIEFLKGKRSLQVIVYGFIVIAIIVQIGEGFESAKGAAFAQFSQDGIDALMWLKQNADKNALVMTWWDPGHLIAGLTGLRVHADGAHCGAESCVPYDINARIVDMGRIFSTNNETEAVNLIKKYSALSDDQCTQVKKIFGDRLPNDACKPASEIYVIASNDLISKYYWLSYFGSYNYTSNAGIGRSYLLFPRSATNSTGDVTFGNGVVTVKAINGEPVPWINVPQSGIKNQVARQLVYYDGQGQEVRKDYSKAAKNTADGLLLISPGLGEAVFMEPEIRDSMFTRLYFFQGKGLQHFTLVFQTPTMKIYKVDVSSLQD